MRAALRTIVLRAAVLLPAALLLPGPRPIGGQVQASEKGGLTQVISGTEIELEYHRPSVRGRSPIFGGIVHWGEVWTPGANYGTTLRVSKGIELNGVPIPAGKYSLWIELLEEGPWTLVVHVDTLRGHGNQPTVAEGLYAIPLEHTEALDFEETLTFTVDSVRATSAVLQLAWGNVRVPMKLGIDLGVRLALTPDEAAVFVGEWMYDDTADLPSREEADEYLAEAAGKEYEESMRQYYAGLFAMERPRVIRFEQDPATGQVSLIDPGQDAMQATLGGEEDWTRILIPRGKGVYMLGYSWNGDLAGFDPKSSQLLEFELDEGGRAVGFTYRNWRDEVGGTGVRRPSGS